MKALICGKAVKRMRTTKSKQRGKQLAFLIGIAVLTVLIVLTLLGVFNGGAMGASASLLRCVSSQDVTPFGSDVLYYDGITLYCLNARGRERWTYMLGSNAHFYCDDNTVAAWVGNQLHIINKNGQSTYNDNLADTIQFAKPGSKYVAVVLGSDASPTLVIKDLQGITANSGPQDTYQDMVILDLGFFNNGDYFWTTAVDIYGTVPDMMLGIYQANHTYSGTITLGENLVYAVIFAGDRLNVISTKQLRQFDYHGTQYADGTVLVYGWQLRASEVHGGTAMLLFSLADTDGMNGGINQLRLLSGKIDKRFSLPSDCVGVTLYNKRIYAFSKDTIYRADINAQRFTAISLPSELNGREVTGYLGLLKNGVALLACDGNVYAVTLP